MSEKKNMIVRIAGAAGDGIASTGELFGKTCSRMGLHVMAYNSYQSAIRGGHVWLQLNVGEEKTLTHGDEPEIVVLLNKTSPAVHIPEMKAGGIVFYDSSRIQDDLSVMRDDLTYYPMDFKGICDFQGVSPVMVNVMFAGALITALGLDSSVTLDFIEEKFGKKGEEVVNLNQKVFSAGVEWAKSNLENLNISLKGDGTKRMFMTGNDAFGMGFIAGGIKSYAAYPMSPATGVLHYLSTKAKSDKVIVKQTEDELAAVNWAVGAGHAGVRAATATSGGGYALMVEGVGLAGMLEAPITVINVQRGGPSTGIPTKQEQADINLVMGGNGDFPRIVIAPKDVTDAFEQAARALNLAEQYQCPVIILSDLFLSEHYQTVDAFPFDKVEIKRGKVVDLAADAPRYKRYEVTEDGISPRLYPGAEGHMYCSGSDEHDEKGELISDILAGLPYAKEVRLKMHPKRMRKLQTALNSGDINAPEVNGDTDAEITFVAWGSTYDAVQESIEQLKEEGVKVKHVHFTDIFPLPKDKILEIFNSSKRIIGVENNMTNQMAKLILTETGYEIKESINRFDGEPFTGRYIVEAFKNLKELANV